MMKTRRDPVAVENRIAQVRKGLEDFARERHYKNDAQTWVAREVAELHVALSERMDIASEKLEFLTKWLVGLTTALAILTIALLVFTVGLFVESDQRDQGIDQIHEAPAQNNDQAPQIDPIREGVETQTQPAS